MKEQPFDPRYLKVEDQRNSNPFQKLLQFARTMPLFAMQIAKQNTYEDLEPIRDFRGNEYDTLDDYIMRDHLKKLQRMEVRRK